MKDWILISDHVQYKPTMSVCISVYMFVRFGGTDGRWRLARRCAGRSVTYSNKEVLSLCL